MSVSKLIKNTVRLRDEVERINFKGGVKTVYNPLRYAWKSYKLYLERFAEPPKQIIFMGMNPGPWGMAQTGIPFGEIPAVRDWLGIEAAVGKPQCAIPGRPVTGFNCTRSEVSGRRVWGLMKKCFETPEGFFLDHFIANYCPLIFFDEDGKNITPDKLGKDDREALFKLCDNHIAETITLLKPRVLAGFGAFATDRLESVRLCLPEPVRETLSIIRLPHPSPANPQANRGWGEQVEKILGEAGAWPIKKINPAGKSF